MLFMGGIVGRLLHEFAVTIAAAILVSGFVSLTPDADAVQPLPAAAALDQPRPPVPAPWNASSMPSLAGYAWTLRQTMRFHGVTMAVSALLLIGTVYLFQIVPTGFIPSAGHRSAATARSKAPRASASRRWSRTRSKRWRILAEDPNVATVSHIVPGGNQGRLNIELKPREHRELSADEVIEALRPKLAGITGVRVIVAEPAGHPHRPPDTRSLYQFTLQDPDTAELYAAAPKLEAAMRDLPGLLDVTSDLQIRNPQLDVDARSRSASRRSDSPSIRSRPRCPAPTARARSRRSSRRTNQYQVIMQVAPEFQPNPAALSMLYLQAPRGKLVPLSAVADGRAERRTASRSTTSASCRRSRSRST